MRKLAVILGMCSAFAAASDIGWHPKRVLLSQDWLGTGKLEGMSLSGDSCYTNTPSKAMADLMVKNAKEKKCPECLHQYRYAESQVIDQNGQRLTASNMCWTVVTDNGVDEAQIILEAKGKLLIKNFSLQYFVQSPYPRGELFPHLFPQR